MTTATKSMGLLTILFVLFNVVLDIAAAAASAVTVGPVKKGPKIEKSRISSLTSLENSSSLITLTTRLMMLLAAEPEFLVVVLMSFTRPSY